MSRTPLAALAILLGLLSSPAQAGTYVRLSEIAERYGLTADMDLLTGRYVLTDGTNRVALLPGGYQILVNGRYVNLGERVGSDGGDLIVPASAVLFLDQNIVPKRPPATTVPASVQKAAPAPAPLPEAKPAATALHGRPGTIVIDPGHGGVHTGAHGRMGVVEKDVNLAVAKAVKGLLEGHGWHVVLTRSDDRHLNPEVNSDLDARVAVANRSGADLFVSIHANYAETPSARGFEVYSFAGRAKDAELARCISRSLHSSIEDEDRGVKTASFRVIKRTAIPAVLVEVGFVSHPATERRLATEEYRAKLAEAIARGIDRYTMEYRTR